MWGAFALMFNAVAPFNAERHGHHYRGNSKLAKREEHDGIIQKCAWKREPKPGFEDQKMLFEVYFNLEWTSADVFFTWSFYCLFENTLLILFGFNEGRMKLWNYHIYKVWLRFALEHGLNEHCLSG